MLVAYALGVALVVGAVISLATNSWWFLIVALGAHFLASAFFLVYTFKRIDQGDKPDPVTEARLEAEGNGNGNGRAGGLTDSGRRSDREIVN
jgi:membrane protein implicated in regulation of membrane protease activity